MVNIPSDIVEAILCRLSVKSLKRFRCVVKSWCKLIDSPGFVKLHLSMSLKTLSHQHVIARDLHDFFDVDFTDNDTAKGKASLLRLPFSSRRLIGISDSCNGLFLVVGESLVIWNPFTREFKPVPAIGDADLPVPVGHVSNTDYGFAYDSSNDDYKVVRVVWHMETSSRNVVSRGHIYSLKLNSWRLIDEMFTYPAVKRCFTHVNGALHTLASDGTKIMAFSVESERHSVLTLPSRILTGKGVNLALYKIGGRLCLIRATFECTEVWVMQDYSKMESWVKKLSTAGMHQAALYGGAMKPLLNIMDDYKSTICCSGIPGSFVWFGEAESGYFSVKDLPSYLYNVEACVESLVLLDNEKQVQKVRQVHIHQDGKQDKQKRWKKRNDKYQPGSSSCADYSQNDKN